MSDIRWPMSRQPQISREEFAAKHFLDPKKQWIALLPGSRKKELALNVEPMVQASLRDQGGNYEFVMPVASTLNKDWLATQLYNTWPSPIGVTLTDNARATLMHARAAVVASGTATVEAALSGTPFVVVYRLAPLTWLLGRRLVKLDTFAMPNLIAGKKVVPELIQKDFTAQNVFRELSAIIPDGPARQQMEADLKMVQQRLRDSQRTGVAPATGGAGDITALAKV